MLVVYISERDTPDRFLRNYIYHDTYFLNQLVYAN